MFEDVAYLIAKRYARNEVDEIMPIEEIKREIYVSIRSAGQREVYEAFAHGLKPEIVFVLNNRIDYENEEFIEYNEDVYKIIRTFFKDNDEKLEIVCERVLNRGSCLNGFDEME